MIVHVLVPAGTFATGSDRDRHNDFTTRGLQKTRDGKSFVWFYGARLEVVPVVDADNVTAVLYLGRLPVYRVIGRITGGPGW